MIPTIEGSITIFIKFNLTLKTELRSIYNNQPINITYDQKIYCKDCEGTGNKNKVSPKCSDCDGKGQIVRIVQMGPMITQQVQQCQRCKGSGKSQNNSIDVINGYFNQEVMESIVASKGKADVITANNVFAHINDLQSVIKNAYSLLSDEGLLVFEVSYLGSVLDGLLFDTIYHEHLDYHSVLPLISFLKENGFKVIDILLVESHGGSIRVTSSKQQSTYKPRESVRKFVTREQKHPITKVTLNSFYNRIQQEKNKITSYLKSLKQEGKKIVAYGAPAKLTTLFYEFDINSELVDFVIDDSPLKQGLYTPGSHIPVLAADSVDFNDIDVIFVAAWNFAPSIIEKIKERLSKEAIFVVPLPKFEVITNE